jgi:hypothetical protein
MVFPVTDASSRTFAASFDGIATVMATRSSLDAVALGSLVVTVGSVGTVLACVSP